MKTIQENSQEFDLIKNAAIGVGMCYGAFSSAYDRVMNQRDDYITRAELIELHELYDTAQKCDEAFCEMVREIEVPNSPTFLMMLDIVNSIRERDMRLKGMLDKFHPTNLSLH
jgi:hypothetical protein